MPDPTDFHEFTKPPEGKDPWSQDYYDLLDKIDARLELRGPMSDRPASAPGDAIYVVKEDDPSALDHGKVFRYDGVAEEWVLTDRQYESLTVQRDFDFDLSQYNPHPQNKFDFEQAVPPHFKPLEFADNPVMSPEIVNNAQNDFVCTFCADVFGRYAPSLGKYVMIFEVATENSGLKSAWATSKDGIDWTYGGVCQDTNGDDLTSAWTYFLKWDGEWYMQAPGWYRATDFPETWEYMGVSTNQQLPNSAQGVKDPAFVHYKGRWWIWGGRDNTGSKPDEIGIWYSVETEKAPAELTEDDLTEHADSPIPGGDGTKRESPSGRPLVADDYVLVFMFDNRSSGDYHGGQRAYRFDVAPGAGNLEYKETETSPVVNNFWTNKNITHAIEPILGGPSGQDLCLVDLKGIGDRSWVIWAYTLADHDTRQSFSVAVNDTTFDNGEYAEVNLSGNHPWIDGAENKVVIGRTGRYRVNWRLTIAGDSVQADARVQGGVREGGGNDIWDYAHSSSAGDPITIGETGRRQYDKGDELTLTIRTDGMSNATHSLTATASTTEFSIERID